MTKYFLLFLSTNVRANASSQRSYVSFVLISLFSFLLSGCTQEEAQISPPPVQNIKPIATKQVSLSPELTNHLLKLGQASLEQFQSAQSLSDELAVAVAAFIDQPDEEKLGELRRLWDALYLAYQQGIINTSLDQNSIARIKQRLNQWPIEPGYVDRLPQYPQSGIINDPFVEINEESLRKQHGLTHEYDATLGFQPLAFLLWGEPGLNKFISDDTKVGELGYTHSFSQEEHIPVETLDPVTRRKEYLSILVTVIQADIKQLVEKQESEIERMTNNEDAFTDFIQIAKQQGLTLEDSRQRNQENPDYFYYSQLQQSQLEANLTTVQQSWDEEIRAQLAQTIKPLATVTAPTDLESWLSWLEAITQEVQSNQSVTMQTTLDQ